MIKLYSGRKRYTPDRERSCGTKVRYTDPDDALRGAKVMTKKRKKRYCAYVCQYCDKYHVGTDRAKFKRKTPG